MEQLKHHLIIVMGVSGCGKSTVGMQLAKKLDALFYDGDDLHPQDNIQKMSNGIPLTDEDRWPWLDSICDLAGREAAGGKSVVVACSALKKSYRQRLAGGAVATLFVFLHGSKALISQRQSSREGHFMPAALLESQFATLEDPTAESNVISVDIDQSLTRIIDMGVARLKRAGYS